MKKGQVIFLLLFCFCCAATMAEGVLPLFSSTNDNEELLQLIDENMAYLNKLYPGSTFGFIHAAATRKNTDVLEYLLEIGANPDLLTFFGTTALHHAARLGNVDGVKLLLKHRADPQLRTYESLPTPFESAFVSYHATKQHNDNKTEKILTAMQILLPVTELTPKRFKHLYLNTAGTDRSINIPESAEKWLELESNK